MDLQIDNQNLEVEKLVGAKEGQVLVRAEALVPGAGRDAIVPLLSDATLYIAEADLQTDRIVVEGSISCQAVYRQGEEMTVRALAAQTTLNHVIDVPGAQAGMFCRLRGEVAHVEARYENGHMIFQVACSLRAQVMSLTPASVIDAVSGPEGLQTVYRTLRSVKLAAESSEMALLRDSVALPAGLDARTALMDWVTVELDEARPDLGGVRVKGRAMVETLVSSGVEGRPAVLVRYPIALDQLVELPEWLTGDVFAEADVRSVHSAVEPAGEADGDARLTCEIEARVRVLANATDTAQALLDLYATRGSGVEAQTETLDFCAAARRAKVTESVRGTVLIGEGAPGVGTVIAAQVRPAIGAVSGEGDSGRIEGVMEVSVLYMPGGSDAPASAEAELPFSLSVPVPLEEDSIIDLRVLSAEANALMSDRLEMKIQMCAVCETRRRERIDVVEGVAEGAPIQNRPGIVICWPDAGEDAWSVGKRYGVPSERVGEIRRGQPVVLKI